MAATGYTPIYLYYSSTAGHTPTAGNLGNGELAINIADGILFYKDSGGTVQQIASKSGNVNVSSISFGTTGLTPSTATTGAVTVAGTLATANGGTGLTSFTAKGVVYASSTSALTTGSSLIFDGTNLGIGVASPTSSLQIYNATASTVSVTGDSTVSSIVHRASTDASGPAFSTRKSRGTIASPTAVASGDAIGALSCNAYGGTNVRTLTAIQSYVDTYTSDTNISSYMTFATSPSGSAASTERMRINSSGTLLVGTTNSAYHTLQKSVSNDYAAGVLNPNATNPYGLIVYLSGVTGGAGAGFLTCVDNANRLLIAGNGNVTNVNGSYGTISDIKLKENIVDATPKLDDVMALKVRNFNFKETPNIKQIGFVAQEFEQVFPSMIEETIDRDIEGNELNTTTKSIKTSVLVPVLIKAMQELKTELDQLKAKMQIES